MCQIFSDTYNLKALKLNESPPIPSPITCLQQYSLSEHTPEVLQKH